MIPHHGMLAAARAFRLFALGKGVLLASGAWRLGTLPNTRVTHDSPLKCAQADKPGQRDR